MNGRGLVVAVALALAACQPDAPLPSTPRSADTPSAQVGASGPAPAALEGPDPFLYAKVTEKPSAVPARYAAKLPVLAPWRKGQAADEGWPSDAPPRGHFVDALCHGDGDARSAFLSSLDSAAKSAHGLEDLERYQALLRGCADASRCPFAAEVVASSRPLLARQVVWSALVGCPPEYEAAFDAPDAPVAAVREHVVDRRWALDDPPKRPWPRLIAAARDGERDSKSLVFILRAIALSGDDASRAFVLKRFDETKGAVRAVYGRVACTFRPDPKAAAACAAGCKDAPKEHECTQPPDEVATWPKDLAAAACDERDTTFRFGALAKAYPDKTVDLAKALSACLAPAASAPRLASDDGQRFLEQRLGHLAELDRGAAHTVAVGLSAELEKQAPRTGATSTAVRLRKLVGFLARFPATADLEAELRRMGFSLSAQPARQAPLGASDVLDRNGYFVSFDPETDQWPNEHDHLARDLAHAVGVEARGIVFEEVAPEAESDPYVLRAYVDGVVLETSATAKGDWYDLDAVFGLVNAALAKRGSDRRVALVYAGGNDAVAVAGPARAIRAAHDAGLLDLESAGSQRVDDARARERKLIEDKGYTPLE